VRTLLLPDAEARARIAVDLECNFLVEAGAGAGKTSQMIERMLALVASGRARVDQIAAVTFTRKAAAELRERFQNKLESALHDARRSGDDKSSAWLDDALRGIDSGFIGTIHAFCARMLREHPIEAGLDPDFTEVVETEELRLKQEAWSRACERLAHEGAPELAALLRAGLKPAQIEWLYGVISDNPDVVFPATAAPRPDPTAVREELEQLMEKARRTVPFHRPRDGYDPFQKRLRSVDFSRNVLGWNEESRFFDALEKALLAGEDTISPRKWGNAYQAAKLLRAEFKEFATADGAARRLLAHWHAYRYPATIAFAQRAAACYADERLRTGKLNFQDLLVFTAKLLRDSPAARRSLGNRYRFLLVDEFQDTDPIQAEIIFLLAATDVTERDWRHARPRPGALFVVGDPKQSIYRFRRADIGIYNQVKARFTDFEREREREREGEVLQLVANFRSTEPIEQFVNAVFRRLLPAVETEQQAAFSPMVVQKTDTLFPGVQSYEFDVAARYHDIIADADSDRIASWIAERIARGERTPGDFLLLTNRKDRLHVYARALEARNVPVEVTGAPVGLEQELRELLILLEALSDPADATLTVAALLGLFFGLDYEQLAVHKLAGGDFSFLHEQPLPEAPVVNAMRLLKTWYKLARREPADVAIPRIVEEIGLMPYAAGGELGATRAGALLYALDAVRAAGLAGDTSLRAAIAAIRAATEAQEAEAPLEPARNDVVRVMNLHKAKGLEAKVVVLAFPAGDFQGAPGIHVERPADGSAVGYVRVEERGDNFASRILAQPLDWPARAELESQFDRAEDVRLLYVAATRAEEELVVSRCIRTEDKSPWRALYGELSANWPKLELDYCEAPQRAVLQKSAEELLQRGAVVADLRRQAGASTYLATPVKELARSGFDTLESLPPLPRPDGQPRGTEWGTIVHAALEAAARGAQGDKLVAACRGLLLEFERPLGADGAPAESNELVALVEGMTRSDIWKRAMRSGTALIEVPFAACDVEDRMPAVADGVIDLAFREKAGWIIVDYKTDAVADPAVWQRRTDTYRRQLNLYADYWEKLTGDMVVERVLVLTSVGHELKWGKTGPVKAQQLDLGI
jgi:ATP-dependent helicase/nuclease subunit A